VHVDDVSWLGGIKTKKDAKKAWRAQMYEHHPDRPGGGDPEKAAIINDMWDKVQAHPSFDKLAYMYVHGFDDAFQAFNITSRS
jgi:hypothetical protein